MACVCAEARVAVGVVQESQSRKMLTSRRNPSPDAVTWPTKIFHGTRALVISFVRVGVFPIELSVNGAPF